MNDPKFGYHVIWMLPLFLVIHTYYKIRDYIVDFVHFLKIKWILMTNKDIKKLSYLAGITKKNFDNDN